MPYSYTGTSETYSEPVCAASDGSVYSSGDVPEEVAYAYVVVGCSYYADEVVYGGAAVAGLLYGDTDRVTMCYSSCT